MNSQEIKCIERIEIKGLWGRFDVNWDLNPDVNILVGENGTGKSTILNAFLISLSSFYQLRTAQINIDYTDVKVNYDSFKWYFSWNNQRHYYESNWHLSPLNQMLLNYTIDGLSDSDLLKKFGEAFGEMRIDKIDTTDALIQIGESEKLLAKNSKTFLDLKLAIVIADYVEYQLNKSKEIIYGKQNIDKVMSNQRYFIQTINRLFSATNKTIDETDNRISFTLEDGKKITVNDLSTGEKQLLIILLTVLCQDKKPSILLLDEPEMSLHLRWQYELIEIIRTLNPNCQIIAAVHSPSLFNDGWRNKVFWTNGEKGILKPSVKQKTPI